MSWFQNRYENGNRENLFVPAVINRGRSTSGRALPHLPAEVIRQVVSFYPRRTQAVYDILKERILNRAQNKCTGHGIAGGLQLVGSAPAVPDDVFIEFVVFQPMTTYDYNHMLGRRQRPYNDVHRIFSLQEFLNAILSGVLGQNNVESQGRVYINISFDDVGDGVERVVLEVKLSRRGDEFYISVN